MTNTIISIKLNYYLVYADGEMLRCQAMNLALAQLLIPTPVQTSLPTQFYVELELYG